MGTREEGWERAEGRVKQLEERKDIPALSQSRSQADGKALTSKLKMKSTLPSSSVMSCPCHPHQSNEAERKRTRTILRPRRHMQVQIDADPVLARPAEEADDVPAGVVSVEP